VEPRDADSRTDGRRRVGAHPHDPSHHLVTRDHVVAMDRQITLDDVEVGPADTARLDPDEDVARPGLGGGPFEQVEG
jgi:hypothetical protein